MIGIVCFLTAVGAIWTVPSQAAGSGAEEKQFHEEQHFDYLGALAGVSGLVLFNVAWNQGPTVSWPTPYVYFLLILGILSLVVFFFIESRTLASCQSPFRPRALRSLCDWGRLGQLRYISLLSLAIPDTTQTPHAALGLSAELPLSSNWGPRFGSNWLPHIKSAHSVHNDTRSSLLLRHSHPHSHHANRSNVLGFNVCVNDHHSVWHGYELPCRDYHPQWISAQGASRHCGFVGPNNHELFNLTGLGCCRHCCESNRS